MADEPKPPFNTTAGSGAPAGFGAAAGSGPAESGTPNPVTDDEPTSPRTSAEERERAEGGLSDFVRRAVSAGVGAASRSKDDIMRVAAGEMRSWLEQLNLNEELAKALSKLIIEVKTEIRFRPNDEGKMVPETINDVKIKPGR